MTGCREHATVSTMSSMKRVAMLAVLLGIAGSARAQPITGFVQPSFHRTLEVKPARGRFDPASGLATIWLNAWNLDPLPGSNGIFPDLENVRVWIGEFNDFTIDNSGGGKIISKHGGKLFTYKAPPTQLTGIQQLRIKPMADGSFRFWLKLKDTSLGELINSNPQCVNFTMVIGDDDGFYGVDFLRKGPRWFDSRRVLVDKGCPPEGAWPGL